MHCLENEWKKSCELDMDLFGIAIIAAVAYIIYLGINFTNFKSKLMNEFGRRGIPFEIADNLFTRERDGINSLHRSGMPVDQIVDRYLKQAKSMEVSVPIADTDFDTQINSRRDYKRENKSNNIVEFVVKTLGVQQALFLNEDGTLPSRALDEWSIGYVAGAADAVLEKNDFDVDIEGMAIMACIFSEVFGKEIGPELFKDFYAVSERRE